MFNIASPRIDPSDVKPGPLMYEWGVNSWDFPEDNVDGSIKVLLAPRADVDSVELMESPDIRYDYIIFSPKSPGSARNFLSWSPPAPTSSSGEYVERVEAGDGWWPGVDPRGNAGFIPCEYYESSAGNVIQSSELAGTISIHLVALHMWSNLLWQTSTFPFHLPGSKSWRYGITFKILTPKQN